MIFIYIINVLIAFLVFYTIFNLCKKEKSKDQIDEYLDNYKKQNGSYWI